MIQYYILHLLCKKSTARWSDQSTLMEISREKIFFRRWDSNPQPSKSCHLSWPLPSFQSFASLRSRVDRNWTGINFSAAVDQLLIVRPSFQPVILTIINLHYYFFLPGNWVDANELGKCKGQFLLRSQRETCHDERQRLVKPKPKMSWLDGIFQNRSCQRRFFKGKIFPSHFRPL